jgi:dihydroorotate dehydrogenase (NAD+) catalytic subunit
MNRLKTKLNKMNLNSPIMTASGTWGHSDEIDILRDINKKQILDSLGAFVTKGITMKPRKGNPGLRIVETQRGLLNSIGLQNEGVKTFVAKEMPLLLKYNLPIIVNISADTIEEFGELAAYLDNHNSSKLIEGIEINVSCPNIKEGGMAFGVDPKCIKKIVSTVKKKISSSITVITKLTPNVSDIVPLAQAAIEGGTDVLSMINTIRGMAIDIRSQRPFLGDIKQGLYGTGGLSGPAVKPIGVLMVYECFRKIPECRNKKIPIIGIGGISYWQDALEYIMAGATAVGIGTAWIVRPSAVVDVYNGLEEYLEKNNINIENVVGIANKN